jgi:hypothetical protein
MLARQDAELRAQHSVQLPQQPQPVWALRHSFLAIVLLFQVKLINTEKLLFHALQPQVAQEPNVGEKSPKQIEKG